MSEEGEVKRQKTEISILEASSAYPHCIEIDDGQFVYINARYIALHSPIMISRLESGDMTFVGSVDTWQSIMNYCENGYSGLYGRFHGEFLYVMYSLDFNFDKLVELFGLMLTCPVVDERRWALLPDVFVDMAREEALKIDRNIVSCNRVALSIVRVHGGIEGAFVNIEPHLLDHSTAAEWDMIHTGRVHEFGASAAWRRNRNPMVTPPRGLQLVARYGTKK
jgi:hypothetical protein